MDSADTSWGLIDAASTGEAAARLRFERRYLPVVRGALEARWSGSPLKGSVGDAVQEVFLECFKDAGILVSARDRVDRRRPGFRAWLNAAVHNVARRHEAARGRDQARAGVALDAIGEPPADQTTASRMFDREWARALVHEAREHLVRAAEAAGKDAQLRVELLKLRFFEDLPIRDIAKKWEVDAARLHHDYAKAREEFRRSLRSVIARHDPGNAQHVEGELKRLVQDLS